MTDISNLPIWTSTNGDDWIAATSQSPYFCFVAESEDDVLALAARALTFYKLAIESRENRPEFRSVKRIFARELAA